MKQLELFHIEPKERPDKRPSFRCGKKRANRGYIKHSLPLMEQLRPEIKKIPLIVCKKPYTVRMIPCNTTEEEKKKIKDSFYDKNGKFRINPPGDFEIFGGMATRQ